MRIDKRIATTIVFVVLSVLASGMAWAGECDYCVCKGKDTVNACTKCCSNSQNNQSGESIVMKLRLSDDGKSIVDQNGEEIARFVEGMRVRIKPKADKAVTEKSVTEKSVAQKMQGCFKCRQECIAWDGNKCVKSIRTCDWDFDCK